MKRSEIDTGKVKAMRAPVFPAILLALSLIALGTWRSSLPTLEERISRGDTTTPRDVQPESVPELN